MAIELTAAFRPALNKNGEAKITFKTFGESEGTRKDGTPYKTNKLIFEVMSAIRGAGGKLINVNGGSLDGRLGIVLKAMGFDMPQAPMTEDEEGFAKEGALGEVELDDDGFEIEEDVTPQLTQLVTKFLESIEGKVFTGKVIQNDKGYWDIDVKTLKPFVKPAK